MQEEALLLWALMAVSGLGLLALAALVWLFFLTYPRLIRQDIDYWFDWFHHIPTKGQIDQEIAADLSYRAWSEHLERRQAFWTLFVQFLLSLLVIILITILLLLRIIGGDAGLPILAALGGAAVGQGASAARTISGYTRTGRRPPEAE